ncbi:hypothetical protein QYM36_005820, partial [Artemia franciscana]
MEKMIYHQLLWFVEKNNLIPHTQTGFRKHHSSTDAFIVLTNAINDSLSKNNVLTAAFLDFEGAYDNVDHQILLVKLTNLGLPPKLVAKRSEKLESMRVRKIEGLEVRMEDAKKRLISIESSLQKYEQKMNTKFGEEWPEEIKLFAKLLKVEELMHLFEKDQGITWEADCNNDSETVRLSVEKPQIPANVFLQEVEKKNETSEVKLVLNEVEDTNMSSFPSPIPVRFAAVNDSISIRNVPRLNFP